VEALLSGLESRSFRSRDEQEVAGYAALMETVFVNYEQIPLTESYIKQPHAVLLQHSLKDERHRGTYKSIPNQVEAFGPNSESLGVVFATATPFDTPFRMTELVAWTRDSLQNKQIHPLLVTEAFVLRFLAIHPFQDGNGRLSRALTTLLLLQSGYAYVPYSSLESVIEKQRRLLPHASPNTNQPCRKYAGLEPVAFVFSAGIANPKGAFASKDRQGGFDGRRVAGVVTSHLGNDVGARTSEKRRYCRGYKRSKKHGSQPLE
jgi:hypothetical protein